MKAIFLYDLTGVMAAPWLQAGYECWRFDGQHPEGVTRNKNDVTVGMMFDPYRVYLHAEEISEMVGPGVEFVFGFPECTDLTVAGARWWEGKREENPAFQDEALSLCQLVQITAEACGVVPWAFENPARSWLCTNFRSPDHVFHPCDYSGYLPPGDVHPLYPDIYPPRDRYNKETGLWTGNGFCIPPHRHLPAFEKDNPGWKKCGGKSTRTKNIRSCTPRGFAQAVFEANAKVLIDELI